MHRCAALVQLVGERLIITQGHLSQEALDYKNFVLQNLCKSGTKQRKRQVVLAQLPNGDWRKRGVVEHLVAPGVEYDRASLCRTIQQGLLTCLASSLFKVFPRHRWLACDQATDQLALAECIHGLGSAAFLRMLGHSVDVAPPDQARVEPRGQPHRPACDAPAHMHGEPGHMQMDEQRVSLSQDEPHNFDDPSAEHLVSGFPSTDAPPEQVWSQENARRRKVALSFWRSEPLAHMLLCRLVMHPLCELLSSHLTRAGQAWQDKAVQAAARETLAGDRKEGPASRRGEYIEQTSERRFFGELAELLTSPQWRHLPTEAWTVGFQSLTFRATSKMGCCVQQSLVQPTLVFPLAMFQILKHPERTAALLKVRPCMQDAFSFRFMQRFAGEQLTSEEALACMEVLLESAHTDTVPIEWTHGRVARLVKVQKVQTHVPTMGFLNGQLLGQKHCARNASATSTATLSASASSSTRRKRRAGQGLQSRPSRGGGGAMRAFIRLRTFRQKGRCDFKALAAEHKEAKRCNTEDYQRALQVGRAGTAHHKVHKHATFGPAMKTIARKRARLARRAASGSGSALQRIDLGSTGRRGSPHSEVPAAAASAFARGEPAFPEGSQGEADQR